MTPAAPLHVVVMGVSGTGKSTVGALLAADLGGTLGEGDSYHPAANIAKMSSGTPLTDEDRMPWLRTLAQVTRDRHAEGLSTVLTCSALRRCYRDVLREGVPGTESFFVHLHADFAVLERRMREREHFMPPSLLRSQFDTLEPLEDDERGVVVDVAAPLSEVMARARAALGVTAG